MSKIKKISDFNLKSKKILLRLDLNVPVKNKKIIDDTRIKASLPTLMEIIKRNGVPIIISHFGRPEGKKEKKFSLKIILKSLSRSIGKKVIFCNNCIGSEVKKIINDAKPSQILLLENLRFHKEETENSSKFAKNLSENCDIFINDAFSASHRKHSSIDKITKFLPSGIGKNMEKEIINLNKYLKKPNLPLTAIVGGAKMSSKINLINSLTKKCKFLILGGGIANTFIKSNNINVGKSIYEKKQLKNAVKIQKKARENKCKIVLPLDVVVSGKNKTLKISNVNNNDKILDIGNETILAISKIILMSKTVIWSGPLGYFEKKPFDNGTNKIASLINSKKFLVSVAGGGDTIAAIKKNKKIKNFSFLSTGGGAFLYWLENLTLPGIEVLKK